MTTHNELTVEIVQSARFVEELKRVRGPPRIAWGAFSILQFAKHANQFCVELKNEDGQEPLILELSQQNEGYSFKTYTKTAFVGTWKLVIVKLERNDGRNEPEVPVINTWMKQPHLVVEKLVFEPSVSKNGIARFPRRTYNSIRKVVPEFNIFHGYNMLPSDCEEVEPSSLLRTFCVDLCDGNREVADALMAYLAFKIQHPERAPGYHIAIRSNRPKFVQHVLYRCMRAILGVHCTNKLSRNFFSTNIHTVIGNGALPLLAIVDEQSYALRNAAVMRQRLKEPMALLCADHPTYSSIRNLLNLIVVLPLSTKKKVDYHSFPMWHVESEQTTFQHEALLENTNSDALKGQAHALFQRTVEWERICSQPPHHLPLKTRKARSNANAHSVDPSHLEMLVAPYWTQCATQRAINGIDLTTLITYPVLLDKEAIVADFAALHPTIPHIHHVTFWKYSYRCTRLETTRVTVTVESPCKRKRKCCVLWQWRTPLTSCG